LLIAPAALTNLRAPQSLFPIVQGGFDVRLRDISLQQLVERDCPGYAIGGLAGGEGKDVFWRVVAQSTAGLPPGKPRYVMGIGYPLDIVICRWAGARNRTVRRTQTGA
jgi:queuine tRNA-ribosyltransferase